MTVREQTQAIERQTLSPWACLAERTRGRSREETPCPMRTDFQRDRDRIIHCKAFRRLKGKTQVFFIPEGDHYRTRLTHTLEVMQIGRTIARCLRLNEDLTEAIAMGHDLGHTPFGHTGEQALCGMMDHGFRHNLQSVRVVSILERDGAGLNLTWEVRNGIACHSSKSRDAQTLEGRVVRLADKIAYLNHDIEDSIRAGVLAEDDIPYDVRYVLGRDPGSRISTFVTSIVENSGEDIAMGGEVQKAYEKLRDFMFEMIYTNEWIKGEEDKAIELVRRLCEYYIGHRQELTGEYQEILEAEGPERAACDYISGMTDQFAVARYRELFLPKMWGIK